MSASTCDSALPVACVRSEVCVKYIYPLKWNTLKDFKILHQPIMHTTPVLLLRHKYRSDPSSVNPALVMRRNCINRADNFCYICGEVTSARQRKTITAIVKRAYHLYFGCKIGDQDKSCAPHICCREWAKNLSQRLNDERHAMPFDVPMVWREPSNHTTDCYFCMVPPVSGGITKKKKWTIVYPNIPSALRPVLHGEGISVPEPPK